MYHHLFLLSITFLSLFTATAIACEDPLDGEYLEVAPYPDTMAATLVFQADGQGYFEYQGDNDEIRQDPFNWQRSGADNITLNYLDEAGEVTWVEHYVCTKNQLATIVEGRFYVHEKLPE